MNLGHWIYEQEFDINDWFGFIYRIVEINTGKEYIGKKQFFQYLRKSVPGKKNKKKVVKESNWKTYTGSSENLNKAIEQHGMSNYKFIIESLHKTKGSLHYAEIRCQITEDVLRTKLSDGVTRKYYNGQIAGVKFLPPDEHTEETKNKIALTLVERYQIDPHWRSTLTEEEMKNLNDKFYSGKSHYTQRLMTEEEREQFIKDNFTGENNSRYGKVSPNRGKTYFEIHSEESPLTGISYEERYGAERAAEIIESQVESRGSREGEDNTFFGKTHTDEQKEKWKTDERRIKTGDENGMHGKSVTDFMSEEEIVEWKKSISASTKGVPKKKTACPHCGTMCAPNMLHRYHLDKCKHKK